MKRIEAAISIAAKPDHVWAHLTDFAAYPDWNPFVQQIEGSLDLGKTLESQDRSARRQGHDVQAQGSDRTN